MTKRNLTSSTPRNLWPRNWFQLCAIGSIKILLAIEVFEVSYFPIYTVKKLMEKLFQFDTNVPSICVCNWHVTFATCVASRLVSTVCSGDFTWNWKGMPSNTFFPALVNCNQMRWFKLWCRLQTWCFQVAVPMRFAMWGLCHAVTIRSMW